MSSPVNIYDQASRFAVKLAPAGLLHWRLPLLDADLVFARWLETQNVAFPGEPDRRCDTVAEMVSASGQQPPWALVIETQSEPEPAMAERELEYVLGVRRQLRHGPLGRDKYLVGALLINLTGAKQDGRLDMAPPGRTQLELHWGMEVCTMSEESAATLLRRIAAAELPRDLLVWTPLMADGDDLVVISEWKRLALLQPEARRRAEYAGLALVFAELANRRDIWAEALKEWNMRESVIANEWKNEGRVQGRIESRREDLLKVLQARFPGPLPGEVVQVVNTQDNADSLTNWLIAAATAPTIEQFRSQLRV